MHDIDRTQLESEFEYVGEAESEEFLGTLPGELESPLTEMQELELASELLEVTNAQELDRFLGDVFKTVSRAAGQFVRSDTGRALGGILRNAARQALPAVGGAIGGWAAPNGGANVGRRLAERAGSMLGLELEGLSAEDQEFEAARQFSRFVATAVRNALGTPPNVPAPVAAAAAVRAAAQRFAPGLAGVTRAAPASAGATPPAPARPAATGQSTGRWVRQGNAVVLIGL